MFNHCLKILYNRELTKSQHSGSALFLASFIFVIFKLEFNRLRLFEVKSGLIFSIVIRNLLEIERIKESLQYFFRYVLL